MPGTVASDGPTVSLSFANNFWGKDDAGVVPLLDRMHNAKVTGDELKAFYSARAQIEEDYAKKLLSLSRKPLGSNEAGTLRMSLDVVRGEVETMGKSHQQIAGQMKSELEEPLQAFAGGIKERRKIVQGGIEKLLKMKNQQTGSVNKARDRFEQDCLKIKGYLAQGHMVMGQEERKNKSKLEKTQIQMSSNSNEYEAAVKILEETTGRWNREWKAACDKFQDLEEERLDFFKSSLWSFANIASTVCVSDDGSCEKIRLSLEDCEVEKDITNFIKDTGTGQEIPDPPKYINFCRGDLDDASSAHESEDGNYSVAQFQRTMNPTYRTSSPQPSTFESHNDPDTGLREEMGIPKGRASMQGDEAFNPRSSHGSAAPPPLTASHSSSHNPYVDGPPPLTASQTSARGNPYADAPQIPHNPYPTDGMTQFCRYDQPSERSSNPSPTRPESRDSQDQDHSDYSAPTSFSSFDPMSGQASPTKNFNGSNLSGASSGGEEKGIQKKKSGFFNSPFRRRSQKSKEQVPQSASVTPSARNTWTPAVNRAPASANTSPTKQSFGAGRANPWQKKPSPSPEPDPVDPRADYQLGVGGNVFDVASPDKRKQAPQKKGGPSDGDPIAAALAELKGVTKQASVRQSADLHYGMASPNPDGRNQPSPVPAPFANKGARNTPPPAYDQPMSRLGAPQPAHTSRDMQKTTQRYVGQKQQMFNGNPSRPGSAMGQQQQQQQQQQQPPRAPSPGPPRATSPRPYPNEPRGQPQQNPQPFRATSPNPFARPGAGSPNPSHYGAQPAATTARPRAQSSSPIKAQPHYGGYSSRGGSPGYQAPPSQQQQQQQQQAPAPRAASPNPAYARPAASRPASSRGSEHGGGAMALQLAPAGGEAYAGGSQRGGGRPQSAYYGGGGSGEYGGQVTAASRNRSQSVAAQRQVTKDGRGVIHYARAMYMYQAAIPEELSFAKGDVLAVTRHQDDGWWEAEVAGKAGGVGLVPSNYLKNC